MHALILSRRQLAGTTGFNTPRPAVSIGAGCFVAFLSFGWWCTGNPMLRDLMGFWSRFFGLSSAMGLAIVLCGFIGLAVSLRLCIILGSATNRAAPSDPLSTRIIVLPVVLSCQASAYWVFGRKIPPVSGGSGS